MRAPAPRVPCATGCSACCTRVAATLPRYVRVGVVHEAVGTVLKARGLDAQVGELCRLRDPRRAVDMLAEVVGFADGSAILMPHGELDGLSSDTEVHPTGRRHQVAVGDAMLGRVVDGFGQPLDGRPLEVPDLRDSHAAPPRPLSRAPIVQPLVTGVRAIDALVPVGRGQRIGIFAPAGVGKSVLLGMLSRHTQCDVRVIALVGERGARWASSSSMRWVKREGRSRWWWRPRRTPARWSASARATPRPRWRSISAPRVGRC